MRIKTAPRHRFIKRGMKVASARKPYPEENVIDVEKYIEKNYIEKHYMENNHIAKDYIRKDSTYATDDRNSYQMYNAPSTNLFAVMMSSISNGDLTLSSSTSTLPSSIDNNNNNIQVKRDTVFQRGQIFGERKEEEEYSEAVNLSIKDARNRVDNVATSILEQGPRLKDTFLYKIMTDPNFLENIQKNKQQSQQKFICLFCKRDFKTCEELIDHMEAKRNENNQIVCCACGKIFAEKRYLKYHRRCHSERTKYTCEICRRKYTRLDNLTRHNVLHVNPNKFPCNSCTRTFTRKDLLNKHQKSHEKFSLFCEKCGRYFRKILTLENHLKAPCNPEEWVPTEYIFRKIESSTENAYYRIESSVDNTNCQIEDVLLGESLICKPKTV